MAMTNAERQRRYREKQLATRRDQKDSADRYLKRSFATFFLAEIEDDAGDWSSVQQTFALAGVTLPDFERNEWPEYDEFELEGSGTENRLSLGKAEMLADAMQDGLRVLAEKISRFKREEVEARITELEAAEPSDAAARKQALDDIVELNRIKARLAKKARLTFPEYEIKG